MKTTVLLCLFILKMSFLTAQNEGYVAEYIEPESDFKTLKKSLKENPLPQIENAFIDWDYNLIEPYLIKDIRKNCRSFFKVNKDSLTKYTWKKRTHTGPSNTIIPGGNFGVSWEFNSLRLQSTDINNATFIVDYYYYVQDSALVIYAMESERYPYTNKLDANLKLWILMDSCIQALRKRTSEKNTTGMAKQLSRLESLKPSLTKQPNFNERGYLINLASNYGNLSWYLIFEGKYEDAIVAAQKGIDYDATQTWIYTNLALSNLLAGHKDIALAIYDRYQNQQTNNQQLFKVIFKADLLEAKKADLINATSYDEMILFLDK